MTFNFTCPNCNSEDRSEVPMTVQFFWPNSWI
jgi:transcription elongation factor Elf1